jgi:hypothetical protein
VSRLTRDLETLVAASWRHWLSLFSPPVFSTLHGPARQSCRTQSVQPAPTQHPAVPGSTIRREADAAELCQAEIPHRDEVASVCHAGV